jgi:hypothetical protein
MTASTFYMFSAMRWEKKFDTNEILIFSDITSSIRNLLNAIYRKVMQKTFRSEHKYKLPLVSRLLTGY